MYGNLIYYSQGLQTGLRLHSIYFRVMGFFDTFKPRALRRDSSLTIRITAPESISFQDKEITARAVLLAQGPVIVKSVRARLVGEYLGPAALGSASDPLGQKIYSETGYDIPFNLREAEQRVFQFQMPVDARKIQESLPSIQRQSDSGVIGKLQQFASKVDASSYQYFLQIDAKLENSPRLDAGAVQ
jgi:hypothetical protein